MPKSVSRKSASKEQILSAIRACVRKLGRAPTRADLKRACGISRGVVERRFGGFAEALLAAGQPVPEQGRQIETGALLLDWAAVARKLKKLPAKSQYYRHGRYSLQPFVLRFRTWMAMPQIFRQFVEERGCQGEWSDVLELIAARQRLEEFAGTERWGAGRTRLPQLPAAAAASGAKFHRRPMFGDRPVYGSPLLLEGMIHEPMNEAGVIFVFGMVARRLGFLVLRMQTGFPDCEALREVRPGHWQRVKIEFEYESRNFQRHGHVRRGCDLIVCWRHNWVECPSKLEVVELRKAVLG